MLHWPDTMFTYMDKEKILFSNDGFGQHLASEFLYADEVDSCELWNQAITYYANIQINFHETKTLQKIHFYILIVTNLNYFIHKKP